MGDFIDLACISIKEKPNEFLFIFINFLMSYLFLGARIVCLLDVSITRLIRGASKRRASFLIAVDPALHIGERSLLNVWIRMNCTICHGE